MNKSERFVGKIIERIENIWKVPKYSSLVARYSCFHFKHIPELSFPLFIFECLYIVYYTKKKLNDSQESWLSGFKKYKRDSDFGERKREWVKHHNQFSGDSIVTCEKCQIVFMFYCYVIVAFWSVFILNGEYHRKLHKNQHR